MDAVPYEIRNLRINWNIELLCPWCGVPWFIIRKEAIAPYKHPYPV